MFKLLYDVLEAICNVMKVFIVLVYLTLWFALMWKLIGKSLFGLFPLYLLIWSEIMQVISLIICSTMFIVPFDVLNIICDVMEASNSHLDPTWSLGIKWKSAAIALFWEFSLYFAKNIQISQNADSVQFNIIYDILDTMYDVMG